MKQLKYISPASEIFEVISESALLNTSLKFGGMGAGEGGSEEQDWG